MTEAPERDYRPISSDTVPWATSSEGTRFGMRYRHLTEAVFGQRNHRVGVAIEELEPGKQTLPLHYHMLEEEHVFILAGELTLRLGEESIRMKAGDYAVFPAGRKVGHCFVNESPAVCRYIIIGENNPNEVCVYPEGNKVGVRWLGERFDLDAKRSYWEGVKTE
jgi:uncharacterized cupin superfamily protein